MIFTLCIFHTLFFLFGVSVFFIRNNIKMNLCHDWTICSILGILVSYNILIGFKTLNMTLLLYRIYHLIYMIYSFYCSERTRENTELTREEKLKRFHLEKKWCVYSYKQYKAVCGQINQATKFAAEALAELRKESEELYVQAIQVCSYIWKGLWNVMIELIENIFSS